jgi:hypothetical protein
MIWPLPSSLENINNRKAYSFVHILFRLVPYSDINFEKMFLIINLPCIPSARYYVYLIAHTNKFNFL